MLNKKLYVRPYSCIAILLCLLCLSACGASRTDGQEATTLSDTRSTPSQPASKPSNKYSAPSSRTTKGTTAPLASNGSAQTVGKKSANGTISLPSPKVTPNGQIAACWVPLLERLEQDNIKGQHVETMFARLPEYSASPMATKIKELYRIAFRVKKPSTGGPKVSSSPYRIYNNIVTQATLDKCKDFLTQYKTTFDAMEKKYAVPREIVAALLYVETRLGTYLGKENAFWSLAAMAAADKPERVTDGISELPLTDEHEPWLQAKLSEKSDWAYNELKALLTHCTVNELDPHAMPGSVYGAIGICQFMPSNLLPYGDDGDGDGKIDLFNPPDAIFSVAKYLTGHRWKKTSTVPEQRQVLKRYNNLTAYANTILALAYSIETDKVQSAPPDAPTAKAVASKGKAKTSKAKGKKASAKSTKTTTAAKAKPASQTAAKLGPRKVPKP